MELKIKLDQLHQRADGLKNQITTEEATKNAFIMPFLQILGYDVFNPLEIIPEFTCDIGTKKGEKIDYAIMRDGIPIVLIECKHWSQDLNLHDNQLIRYFNVSKAKFGILTNGVIYNFYTDLEQQNIMDASPFLTINLDDLKDNAIKELAKFNKDQFDIDKILDSASSLKYINAIRDEFEKELINPSDEFVKMLVSKFYPSIITAKRLEFFKEYSKKALAGSINDKVTDRLKSALNQNEQKEMLDKPQKIEILKDDAIVTTNEELEAFQIIKAILREKLPSSRIITRDTKSYFGVLLDDNNRKPLCRLHLNSQTSKSIELFHNGKDNGEKVKVNSLDDIYNFKNELLKTIDNYE